MKYLSVIAVLLVSAVMLFATTDKVPLATTTVKGVVIDQSTGEALAGVKINLDEETVVYSDLDGAFEIENVTSGSHTIQTAFISYSTHSMDIDINDLNNELQIKLKND